MLVILYKKAKQGLLAHTKYAFLKRKCFVEWIENIQPNLGNGSGELNNAWGTMETREESGRDDGERRQVQE
jgi:hypothetical protein